MVGVEVEIEEDTGIAGEGGMTGEAEGAEVLEKVISVGGVEEENKRGGGEGGGLFTSFSFLSLLEEGVIILEAFESLRAGFNRLETNNGPILGLVACPLSFSQFCGYIKEVKWIS